MFDRIPDITAQRALLKPEAVAFRDLVRGTTFTYRELEARVRSLAGLLLAEGVAEAVVGGAEVGAAATMAEVAEAAEEGAQEA